MCGMVSCVSNYKVVTSINADGSCLREVYAKCDSAFLAGNMKHNPYMFYLDSGWKITTTDSDEHYQKRGVEYNGKISRTFRAINEISAGLRCKEEEFRPLAAPTETFQKRFRWFYTYYTFKAVYPGIADQMPVAIDKYMSRDEQMLWLRGDLSACRGMNGMELNDKLDEIAKRFYAWRSRNFYEACFEAICDFENRLGNSPYASQLPAAKDTLFLMVVIEGKFYEKDMENQPQMVEVIYRMLDKYFETGYFSDLYRQNEAQIDTLCENRGKRLERLEEKLFANNVEYVLTLPGTLVDANTPLINQDTLRWKVTAVRFLTDDYELTATSREANRWAFAVAFFLVALSAYCLVRAKHLTKIKL